MIWISSVSRKDLLTCILYSFNFRVSDQVFEECLREVADELEDINEAVVNQVCKSEFMINSTQTSPGLTPGGSLPHSPVHSPGEYTPIPSPDAAVKMVAFSEKDDLVSASPDELTISDEVTEEGDYKEETDEEEESEEYEDDYEEEDDD